MNPNNPRFSTADLERLSFVQDARRPQTQVRITTTAGTEVGLLRRVAGEPCFIEAGAGEEIPVGGATWELVLLDEHLLPTTTHTLFGPPEAYGDAVVTAHVRTWAAMAVRSSLSGQSPNVG